MKPQRNVFGFEIDISGASVVVVNEPLTSAVLSEQEVDWQIEALKNNLDDVANKMKTAIRKQESEPVFGGS